MPEPFDRISGVIAALPAANIDTDVIMPKTFLKGIDRSGLEKGLFHDLRFTEDGIPKSDFILNRKPWHGARFLVTGANFGCGSSREHAVWGLCQFGIKAIIAPSFAGIFFDNCVRNGLLAIEAEETAIKELFSCAHQGEIISINLQSEQIETPSGTIPFTISPRRKYMLLNGLDAIGRTLEWRAEIEVFQSSHRKTFPWLGK